MVDAADAERALQLADEAWGRGDVEAVVAQLSVAVRGFTAADDRCRAAMACVRLGDAMASGLRNLTAARAWFVRAARLLEDQPPCVEQGWVAVAAIGCDVDDPDRLLGAASLALDRARQFGDVNLETKALADAGLAHVQAGRVAVGMAMLDEAMALACGPADDFDAVGRSVCSFFTACYFAVDFDRAGSWSELLRRRGVLSADPGPAMFLSSHCDSVQATLLMELGRWGDAEALLLRTKRDFEAAMAGAPWHPDIALADLRVRQGRYADAEALLLGKDQSLQALLPAAHLHLARGDADLARAAGRRGLRAIGTDRLRAVELLTVLVDAELARGDDEAAAAAAQALEERTEGLDVPSLEARALAARARVLAAGGDRTGAIVAVEQAVDRLDVSQLPWLHVTLLLDLARLREQDGDTAGATVDAKAAGAALATLDVVLRPSDVALLERLTAPSREGPAEATLHRDGKWWVVTIHGERCRLQDTKGLRYLATLLERPGQERHALDLVDGVEGVAAPGGPDRRRLGDAGPALDSQARTAYRHRLEEVRLAIDEALADERLAEAEALQAEHDLLVAQLAGAFGLGGRARAAAGSAAERARLNVTRAIRAAIARIGEETASPVAAHVLDRRVRTGLYCAYEPAEGDEVRWTVGIVRSRVNEHASR